MCFPGPCHYVEFKPVLAKPGDTRDVFGDGSLIILRGDKNEVYLPKENTKLILLETNSDTYIIDYDAAGYSKRLAELRFTKGYEFDNDWSVENGIVVIEQKYIALLRLVL